MKEGGKERRSGGKSGRTPRITLLGPAGRHGQAETELHSRQSEQASKQASQGNIFSRPHADRQTKLGGPGIQATLLKRLHKLIDALSFLLN